MRHQARGSATQRQGAHAEQLAEAHLAAQGLQLLTRNYRIRRGEIDLVMLDGAELVFVEVRQRASQQFGGGAASVDARKQARLWRTAEFFLQQNRQHQQRRCRFDVVALGAGDSDINWIKNAFAR